MPDVFHLSFKKMNSLKMCILKILSLICIKCSLVLHFFANAWRNHPLVIEKGKTILMFCLCLFNIVSALSALKHTPVSSSGKLARMLKYFSLFQSCLISLSYNANICNILRTILQILKPGKICAPNERNISEK